jgi:hypothetical protein
MGSGFAERNNPRIGFTQCHALDLFRCQGVDVSSYEKSSE